MMFIWSYVLVLIAAFFNACMDAFENTPNFNESIFKDWDKRFWCKDVSWQYAKRLFGYKLDSWHISKSLMWCAAIGAIIIAYYTVPRPSINWMVHFFVMALLWNVTFVFFYHRIFKVK